MNTNLLLAHFDRIADAPDAIPRLRRFILDLAVRGKLVPPHPDDELASELLKRVKRTLNKRKNRKLAAVENEPNGINLELPGNWELVPLGEVGEWATGTGFPKSEQGRTEGAYFFLKVSDMNLPGNEKVISATQNWIDDKAAARIHAKVHSIRTIIFPKIGGAIATNKRRILGRPSAIDNNCLGITISNEIDLEWAYLLLTSLDFTRYQAGTAVPALQQSVLERIPVGIPPLAEQHRIVAKVDELMALCDRLEAARTERETTRNRLAAASLARLNAPDPDPPTFRRDAAFALDNLTPLTTRPDQIKTLRQTILNLAVRGKLVPQDPYDEPEMRQHPGKAERERLPISWRWLRLEDFLSENTKNGYSRKPDDAHDGIPILRISAGTIRIDGLVAEEEHRLISGVSPDIRAEYGLTYGDLLACRFNGNRDFVGRMKVFKDYLRIQPMYPDKLIRVRVNLFDAVPEFIQIAGESDLVRRQVEDLCATTVGNWGINASKLKQVSFPLPPFDEQHRIVAEVDALMTLCERLEANLKLGDETRARLLESVLHEALEMAADGEHGHG